MYRHILVPLDGSAIAEEVIPFSLTLSKAFNSGIRLLRVVDEPGDEGQAQDYVRELGERIGAEGRIATAGDAAAAILDELRFESSTLLTMTTHGRTGLLGALLGSVAQQVVSQANAPVLIYRPRCNKSPSLVPADISTIVVPLDGSEYSERILSHSAGLASALGAQIVLVQVLDPPDGLRCHRATFARSPT